MVHICCITCPRDLPDMYTHALGPRAWVYISGKSLGYMIQLLHVYHVWLYLHTYVYPTIHIIIKKQTGCLYHVNNHVSTLSND